MNECKHERFDSREVEIVWKCSNCGKSVHDITEKDLRTKLEEQTNKTKFYKRYLDRTKKLTTQYFKENSVLRAKLEAAEKALDKINDIRNNIVGLQKINWSEHIYPLVAALNAAGLQGLHYPDAREYYGTMLERTKKAEKQRDEARAQVVMLREALGKTKLLLLQANRDKKLDDSYYDLIIFGRINPALTATPAVAGERVKELLKAVEWMKSIGDFFKYKAPEQIDATKLVASMYATAEEALAKWRSR